MDRAGQDLNGMARESKHEMRRAGQRKGPGGACAS